MSSKTSTKDRWHIGGWRSSHSPTFVTKKLPENALHTFVFEIFIGNRFSVCEDSLGSSVYEFMVGKCFGVFYTSVHILNTEQNIKMY